MNSLQEISKRVTMSSPALFIKLQNWCMTLGALCTLLGGVILQFYPIYTTQGTAVLTFGLAIGAIGTGLAKLPVQNPELINKPKTEIPPLNETPA